MGIPHFFIAVFSVGSWTGLSGKTVGRAGEKGAGTNGKMERDWKIRICDDIM